MPKGMSFIIYWESACATINYMENGYFQLGDITIKINITSFQQIVYDVM